MKELAQTCKNLKQEFSPKKKDSSKPAKCWSEKDVLNGKTVDAFVLILKTNGCSWAHKSGCTMCGYFTDSLWTNVSTESILTQFNEAMKNYQGEQIVKIFTSGSFFDDDEVPASAQTKMLTTLAEQTKKINVESRPEYVSEDMFSRMKTLTNNVEIEVGVGLETANDIVRDYTINKGFTLDDYLAAAKKLKDHDFNLKTYVLVKPPFLTEREAITDCVTTVEKIKHQTDTISFNPTNIQRHTLVEHLWKRRQYRPPWLWSIIKILQKSSRITTKRLQCDVVGGGSIRGAHNCKHCNKQVLQAIEDFSLNQNAKVFDKLDCSCKNIWYDQLELEPLSFGSLTDGGESI